MTSARGGLDQIADILTDLGDLYSKCEPSERRILNRALFKRVIVDGDENTTFVPVEPAASVLASGISSTADDPGPDTNLPRHQTGQVSIFSTYVDLRGLEPLTPCMPCRCATSCATGPDGLADAQTPGILHFSFTPVVVIASIRDWASMDLDAPGEISRYLNSRVSVYISSLVIQALSLSPVASPRASRRPRRPMT